MSASHDLCNVHLIVNQSERVVEETRSKCQEQVPRLYNQRQLLLANRHKRLAREAKQRDELRELYRSLGLVQPVELDCPAPAVSVYIREANSMSCITLQTGTGPEEYQISDLDEVVWWRTEKGVEAVGYMDAVSGLISEDDLETCRMKRPEIVREIVNSQL